MGGAKRYPSILPVWRWVSLRSTHPTNLEYDFAFSRRVAPGVLLETLPSKYRGRREDRVRAAPAVSRAMCIKKMRTRAYRFGGNTPAFPAQWLYGLYEFVLVTGFLATIIGVGFRLRQLDASTGASDPHDFTVRKSALVSRDPASTASHRTS